MWTFQGRVLQTLSLSLLAEQPLDFHTHETKPAPIDFAKLHSYFGWVKQGMMEKTFKHTTLASKKKHPSMDPASQKS